jgi:CheY-like chemotaxis protein
LTTVRRCLRNRKYDTPVLVVEDNDLTREIVVRSLEDKGMTVMSANDGIEALACVDRQCPGLILLDLILPRMNGLDFLLELRKRAHCSMVPVVVMTERDISDADREKLHGQVENILQKGAHFRQEVLEQVKELMVGT